MQRLLLDIPDGERTPLVRQLLDVIYLQHDRIQQLEERIRPREDEIARLQVLKARPRIASVIEFEPSWSAEVGSWAVDVARRWPIGCP